MPGGYRNTASGFYTTVSGGTANSSSGQGATVGGGGINTNSGDFAVIGGGDYNVNRGYTATLSGGQGNIINISGSYGTVGGGIQNSNSGIYATVPGGRLNSATDYGFAAGNRAKANHQGAFVWGDSTDADFASTANNQFLIRAAGGVGVNKTNPATALDVNGTVTAINFSGPGAGLTGLNAGNLTGTVSDARLTANVALLNANQTLSGVNTMNNAANSFSGNGAGLTSLNAGNLTGSVPGAALTSVPAGNLTGIVADARLSANVALLNANQTLAGINTMNNAANSFTGNGAGLTSLNAASLGGGTLADARLSANVALRAGGNAFTGTQTITGGNVGIGISPQSTLDVNGTARIEGANNWGVSGGEGDFRVGNDSYRFKIGVANAGGGAGDVWMRAHGGIERINIKAPGGTRILSNEAESSGVSLAANGTSWGVISDRNVKKDFAAVDSVAILEKLAAMPITQWHYQWEESSVTPHIGPMAQDFKAAFYPGTDDKSITTQEADGVALAAIQGLNQKLEAEVKSKDARIAELEKRLAAIETLLQK